ncbi:helix-turn-helix domain-containing protein [Streptomyces yanii]|uniref:helix-turn-helix domain-containing protein n=1 Tax=Streptomyces yanii TaxID=78510 RepID=UPI0033732ED9
MRPRGKPVGVHQVLGEAEQAAVRQAVLDHRPCDMGLSGQLWTRRLVGELIAKLYRVRLTEVGVGKYLKRWGLSCQRADLNAHWPTGALPDHSSDRQSRSDPTASKIIS